MPARFEAAIFDLDGVVTFTARVHAAAWKELFDTYLRSRERTHAEPFRPFTEADYRTHVDGRPRSDGVRTFLASRGITLPEGRPDDPPEAETIAGLGNRKNALFHARLREMGVEVDAEAVRLVRELRARGIRVGVASSSKNTGPILEMARLEGLFDARVDGIVSERLHLRGKPAPDSFLECLRRLGTPDPRRAMVVEDAEAGVEAGRAGGFGLVLGVDRGGRAIALREHGADWIVRDFRDVSAERIEVYLANRPHTRPNAIAAWGDVAAELRGRRPAVFLDYDGTLTPIVDRPDLAVLSAEMRQTLRRLAAVWPTAVVSGRARDDVAALVGIDALDYAGAHGFDIAGPDVSGPRLEVEPGLAPAVARAAEELRRRTAAIPGVIVEDKRFAAAVHYRLVAAERVPEVERIVDGVLGGRPELKKTLGKKVFELRPAIEWDKGRAVRWLLDALGLKRPDIVPIYVGDDATDEDAFRALQERGIGILVTDTPQPTAARYSLQDVVEVRELLERLASLKATSPA
ncbi:MAG TPA: trehalose-phosphatase [Longimicrobiales bacterium]|nr:trehalose-phosphatase [Longimicrobiales bacterium]